MSRTKQPDYDRKPDYGDLVEKHRQLPFKRFMDIIGAKLDDMNDLLKRPLPYDQGPGRIVPYSMPAWFGPLPLTTARRVAAASTIAGHELSATIANPANYFTSNTGPMLVDQSFSFRCMSMMAYGFVNWGYKSDPGFTVPYTNPNGVGDILDPVGDNPAIGPNGGAMPMDFFGGTFSNVSTPQPDLPNISFEVELYDKLRGRRIHDARLPSEMFSGGRLAHPLRASPLIFERGSKIEPRLYVNEIRMGSILNTEAAFAAASVKVWVCLVFKGTQNIETPNL